MMPILTPDVLPGIHELAAADKTSSHLLRWLVILLGDLHQPLHWFRGSHDYGRAVMVTWQGRQYTLFAFLEDYLPNHVLPPAAVGQMEKQFQERAMNWGYFTPPEMFRHWAKDAAKAACGQVYSMLRDQGSSRDLSNNTYIGDNATGNPFVVTEEIYLQWSHLVESQTILGGQRLAFILQDILEHQRQSMAHRKGRGRGHRWWWRALAVNSLIALAVVPTLLVVLQWHARSSGIDAWSLLGRPFSSKASEGKL